MFKATETDALRRRARTSRHKKIPNEGIKRQAKIEGTIISSTENKQLIWHGHIQRTMGARLPKQVIEGIPHHKKKRKRHMKTWTEV